ncbi:MAG: SURF1 family protein [Proteobacteria bacterium]|nr:SURF1 family protein [Pseudomonadota bacterium]MDA0992375.1 SURF1 family protein [Pseudomonadota bacterium]
MIEDLIETPLFRKYAPPVAGLLFVALFVSLAMWQLERASEKRALLDLFESDAPYMQTGEFGSLGAFDRIQVDGAFEGNRQVLIDNIVLDSRPGYYVITPFRIAVDNRLLLVNRGWVPKNTITGDAPPITVGQNQRTVRGLVGNLPRVGIRPGEAFEGSKEWPRVAVYPNLDEFSTELEEAVSPIVVLMSPGEDDGFARQWRPNVSGPMMHYAYAFQWFAMAATVLALLLWHLGKRRRIGSAT